jgi:hypothetical protein
VLAAYTTGLRRERTARIERASPEWRSGALPSELRPHGYARLDSNQRVLPSQSSALSTELRASKSLRQESNPHLGRTKGACLPLTLRRRKVETAGIEPAPCSVQATGAATARPQVMRTDGVEPPQPGASGLQPGELANAQRPRESRVAGRARTGASGAHNPGCFRLHHGHHDQGPPRKRGRPDSNRRPLA